MKRRKTKPEKRMEWEERERRVCDDFIASLRGVKNYIEARILVTQAVREGTPGRKYYSNLGFFMQSFYPPDGATSAELAVYIDLLEKFDKEGMLKPGVKDPLVQRLRSAIEAKERAN